MRIGYVLGTYPRVTDTFIQREIDAVRLAGVDVATFSVRTPSDDHLIGAEQRREHARTTYLLQEGPAAMARACLALLLRHPVRWCTAVRTAVGSRQPGLRGAVKQLIYFAEAALVAQAVEDSGLDHLHNHFGDHTGTVTMLAADLAGTGFSLTIHGPDVFFDRHRWRLDVKAQRARFLACISSYARSQVMSVSAPQTWSRMHVVHCGVQPELFAEPEVEPGRLRLLAVGRLDQVKGIPVLLDAVARLAVRHPELRLDLVGDGPHRDEVEARVSALGLDGVVRLLGNRDQADVREELRRTDVLISASFAEGVPVVLMEAMAARLPVVATRIAGIPELVQDPVAGLLVPPGDAAALVDAVERLAALGPDGRRAMGEAGRQVVTASFDAGSEGRRLAALFQASA